VTSLVNVEEIVPEESALQREANEVTGTYQTGEQP
jgi:hypothetical protein